MRNMESQKAACLRPATQGAKPSIRPLLRWAGGKQRIVNRLRAFLPQDLTQRVYREPFLGAGSLFFAVCPVNPVLSDANEHLIRCYESVCENPDLIYRYLCEHRARTSRHYYYKVRDLYNHSDFSSAQAARFIYLNKTCYNGIFRVNKRGEFNVPYGNQEVPCLPKQADLRRVAKLLKEAVLKTMPFEDAMKDPGPGDFFYLDPPYPPLNGTSYFTHYTAQAFGEESQRRLAERVREADGRGAKFMMSNADTDLIRRLYAGFTFTELSVARSITCKAKRYRVNEFIITNYKPVTLGGGA